MDGVRYNGVDTSGNIRTYGCETTFTQSLKKDVFNLDNEITAYLVNNPDTDIYLAGHSLGGVVVFGYLAFLDRLSAKFSLPNGGRLAGVITLDSPIGGITNNAAYLSDVKLFAQAYCNPTLNKLGTVNQLVSLLKTANSSNPLGGAASLEQVIFGGTGRTNQQIATDALLYGAPIVTIGNLKDFLWDPGACPNLLGKPKGDFRSTQWLTDEASSSAIYGRDFASPPGAKCGISTIIFANLNHLDVLSNSQVLQGITQFLPNGGVPNALAVAPPKP